MIGKNEVKMLDICRTCPYFDMVTEKLSFGCNGAPSLSIAKCEHFDECNYAIVAMVSKLRANVSDDIWAVVLEELAGQGINYGIKEEVKK